MFNSSLLHHISFQFLPSWQATPATATRNTTARTLFFNIESIVQVWTIQERNEIVTRNTGKINCSSVLWERRSQKKTVEDWEILFLRLEGILTRNSKEIFKLKHFLWASEIRGFFKWRGNVCQVQGERFSLTEMVQWRSGVCKLPKWHFEIAATEYCETKKIITPISTTFVGVYKTVSSCLLNTQ